nr:5571_t:CDS:1 [Entrophospora candida]
MIFSNAFTYASSVLEEKRDVDSLEKRAPPPEPDIGKAAFARFGDNDKVKGVVTFVEEFDVKASYRLLVTTALFSDGFVDPNVNNYRFIIGDKSVTDVFSTLQINSPKAKFSGDCSIIVDGLRVKDIVGKKFVILRKFKKGFVRIGQDKISAF